MPHTIHPRLTVAAAAALAGMLTAACAGGSEGSTPSPPSGPAHQIRITVTGGPDTPYQVIRDNLVIASARIPPSRQDTVAFTAVGQVPELRVKVVGQLPDTFDCDIVVDGHDVARKRRVPAVRDAPHVTAICDAA